MELDRRGFWRTLANRVLFVRVQEGANFLSSRLQDPLSEPQEASEAPFKGPLRLWPQAYLCLRRTCSSELKVSCLAQGSDFFRFL